MERSTKKEGETNDSLSSNTEKYISDLIISLKQQNYTYEQIFQILNDSLSKAFHDKSDILLPISIFNNNKLSCLETIVKYMRENLGLKFSTIAKLLGRNNVALANCYRITRQKLSSPLHIKPSKFSVPCSIFKDRRLSILENMAFFLKNSYHLTFHDIAVLLNRNDRTIWTVHHRALRKLDSKETDETA